MLDNSAGSTETFAEAAQGAYDERWRSAMQSILRRCGSKTTFYFRPADEMNGHWTRWAVNSDNIEDFRRA